VLSDGRKEIVIGNDGRASDLARTIRRAIFLRAASAGNLQKYAGENWKNSLNSLGSFRAQNNGGARLLLALLRVPLRAKIVQMDVPRCQTGRTTVAQPFPGCGSACGTDGRTVRHGRAGGIPVGGAGGVVAVVR
jgi:hypothetical protein